MLLPTTAFLSLLSLVLAAPSFVGKVVHDSRSAAPEGYVSNGPASGDQMIDLRIALTSRNMAGLVSELYAVSDPASTRYGQHLSKEAVEAFVQPTEETTSLVNGWLASNGLESKKVSDAGEWIGFTLSISDANKLLDTHYESFTHTESSSTSFHTLSYSVPSVLAQHIEAIHPTTSFIEVYDRFPIASTPFNPHINASCTDVVRPDCLQALYGIPRTKATQASNTIGVPGFTSQYAQTADLTAFLKTFRPDLSPSTSFALQTLDGGKNPQDPKQAGIEANLDIQYTIGLASGVPTTFISVGLSNPQGFLDLFSNLIGANNPSQVLTVSYGFNENQLSRGTAGVLCNAAAQLGARGTSVLFASGDGGVGGSRPNDTCTTFIPTFPAGCPYITAVGATTGTPEVAADLSSGGFSNYFGIPAYQKNQVGAYKSGLGSLYSGKYNDTGRGYPDISAQGHNIGIFNAGQGVLVDGTSASCPIFASVIALINDQRIAAKKSPMGFLNPFLYSSAGTAALNDVTAGSNPSCGTSGFPAKARWDAATGLGTPKFNALLSAAMAT